MKPVRAEIPFSSRRRQRVIAALLRGSLRALVRPLFHPAVPVAALRAGLRASSAITLQAGGVTTRRERAAGVPVEWQTPSRAGAEVVLYLHGGAYCVGSPATHRGLTTHLARYSGARVMVPDYRLAPEHPFPAACDDALACYQWLLDQGHESSQITIAGDSAGGGLALSTALRIRDADLPAPARLALLSPWVDLTLTDRDAARQPREHILSWETLAHAAEIYAGNRCGDPLASPLLGDLRDLPPTLILVGTEEILLAEAERLARTLQGAGNDTALHVYQELWHVFPVHAGILDAADRALDSIARFIAGGQISDLVESGQLRSPGPGTA